KLLIIVVLLVISVPAY
ncbi:type I toxin-antitoxin system Ibs family toxin, partial [Escherichia coli]